MQWETHIVESIKFLFEYEQTNFCIFEPYKFLINAQKHSTPTELEHLFAPNRNSNKDFFFLLHKFLRMWTLTFIIESNYYICYN